VNLSHLYYFTKLADLQHYNRAAKELYISQPSLTHAIKALENELGVLLFERVGRRVVLTEFGRKFSECVTRGLREIENGVSLAKEHRGTFGGKVNVGTIITVQGDYLPALIHAYQTTYGESIKFSLHQAFSIPLIEGLDNDEYDMVFSAKVQNRPDLCFEHVVSQELVVCVSNKNPLAQQKSLSLEDLRNQRVYTYQRGTPLGEKVQEVLEDYSVKASQEFEDEITLGGMVAANPDICGLVVNTIGLKPFDNLAVLPIENLQKDFHRIYLVYKRNKFRSQAAESFLEFALDYARQNHRFSLG